MGWFTPSSGVPKSAAEAKMVKTTSSAAAIALRTESRCLRKKPVTSPTVDMMPMTASSIGEQMAARLDGESASSRRPCHSSSAPFHRIELAYLCGLHANGRDAYAHV